MSGYGSNRKALWKLLGILCCVLIACAAGIQAAHIHPDGQTAQSLCALCHIAHVAVQVPVPQVLPGGLVVVASLIPSASPKRARHLSVFSLFTRPPPVDLAFA